MVYCFFFLLLDFVGARDSSLIGFLVSVSSIISCLWTEAASEASSLCHAVGGLLGESSEMPLVTGLELLPEEPSIKVSLEQQC